MTSDFDKLVEDDDDDDGVDEDSTHTSEPSENTGQMGSVSENQVSSPQNDPSTPDVDLESSGAGFPFDTQETVYVTTESWTNFDDLKHATETYLRNEFNVRNVQGRELDEVFLRLAVDKLSPEELGDMIVRLRGYDPEKHR